MQTVANALHLFDQALIGMALLTIVLVLAAILFAHRTWSAVAWLGITIVVMLGLILIGLLGIQSFSGNVVANPDSPVLVAALVGALAGSLATWLGVIAFAILIITIPAAFMARRVSRENRATKQLPQREPHQAIAVVLPAAGRGSVEVAPR